MGGPVVMPCPCRSVSPRTSSSSHASSCARQSGADHHYLLHWPSARHICGMGAGVEVGLGVIVGVCVVRACALVCACARARV